MSMSLQQIDDYFEALCKNASQLITEAKALHGISAYARAYALAHFAREELSKASMLHAAAARLIAKHPVDWKSLTQRLRDHKAKLRLELVELAFFLKANGRVEQADDLLSENAVAIAEIRNDLKNTALYVGFNEGKVTQPSDTQTEHQSWRTIELAEARYRHIEFIRKNVGPFAARKIGSLKMPDLDELVTDEATLDRAAKTMGQLMSLVEADALARAEAEAEAEANDKGQPSATSAP